MRYARHWTRTLCVLSALALLPAFTACRGDDEARENTTTLSLREATTIGVVTHEYEFVGMDFVQLDNPMLMVELNDGTSLVAAADDVTFNALGLGPDFVDRSDERVTWSDDQSGVIYLIVEDLDPGPVRVAEVLPGEWFAEVP